MYFNSAKLVKAGTCLNGGDKIERRSTVDNIPLFEHARRNAPLRFVEYGNPVKVGRGILKALLIKG